MPTHLRRSTIGCLLLSGLQLAPGGVPPGQAQSSSEATLPLGQAQAVWRGFWNALIVGDLEDARTYVHSERQHLFPGPHKREELQQMASEMAHCRLNPDPVIVALEEVIYRVLCEHRGETARSQVGLRRDRDGAWRLSLL
ncbi:MAG TPA: hypothetical protein VLG10_15770 [Methylomirabilota bacterium]|nr:hypothetical protein [Methylomirabilota bacterium]